MLLLYLLLLITVQTLATSISSIVIFRKYLFSKLTPELALTVLLLLLTLWGIFFATGSLIADSNIADLLFRVGVSFGTAGFIIIYIFIISLVGKTNRLQDIPIFSVIIFLYGVFFTSVIFYDGIETVWVQEEQMHTIIFKSLIVRLSFIFLALIIGVHLILTVEQYLFSPLRKQKYASKKTKYQLYLLLISAIISIFGSSIASAASIFLPPQLKTIPFHALVLIGSLAMLGAYLVMSSTPYLLSCKPIALYVVTDEGIPLFTFKFIKFVVDEALLAGLITAFKYMGKKTLKTYSEIKYVMWRSLSMTFVEKKNVQFVIISEEYHQLLYQALKTFADTFCKKYSPHMKAETREISLFKDAIMLIEQTFPFVVVTKNK